MQKFPFAFCGEESFKNHSIPANVIGGVTWGIDTIKTIIAV